MEKDTAGKEPAAETNGNANIHQETPVGRQHPNSTQDPIQSILDDPDTNQWLSKTPKNKQGVKKQQAIPPGNPDTIHDILDDPNTNQWLSTRTKSEKGAKKQQAIPADNPDTANNILSDPETGQWISQTAANGAASISDSAVNEILSDPETNQWISKTGKGVTAKGSSGDAAVNKILSDPETIQWLSKKDTRVEITSSETAQIPAISPRTREEMDHPLNPGMAPQTNLSRQNRLNTSATQPGAFSAGVGEGLQRRDNIPFSLVGAGGDHGGNPAALVVGGNVGLAEAMPVEEDGSPGTEAQPFDMEAAQRRKASNKRLLSLLILAVIVCAIVLAVGLGVGLKDEAVATLEPASLAPTYSPTSAPTSVLYGLMEDLPEFSLTSLEDPSSPQWEAREWLLNHPDLPGMPKWRKQQLFAMATFYHSMAGPHWPQAYQDTWMQYDRNECRWFANQHGSIDHETGQWYAGKDDPTILLLPECNDDGRLQVVAIREMNVTGHNTSIPPEISLLTSLSLVNLEGNAIAATLDEYLPSHFFQMRHMKRLTLSLNRQMGRIPSEFGLMSGLEYLDIYGSGLTGTIPTELGRMSSMAFLTFQVNDLTGTIPNELGLMSALTYLDLGMNTQMTGTVPESLCSLGDGNLTFWCPLMPGDPGVCGCSWSWCPC